MSLNCISLIKEKENKIQIGTTENILATGYKQ